MARYILVPTWFAPVVLSCLIVTAGVMAQDKTVTDKTSQEAAGEQESAEQKSEATKSAAVAATQDPEAAGAAQGDPALDAAFEEKFAEWKAMMIRLRKLRTDYQTAAQDQRKTMANEWDDTVAEAEKLLPELIQAVLEAYKASPNADRVKTNFLAKVLNDFVTRDMYVDAIDIGRVMFQSGCEMPEVFRDTGIAAFAMNEYELMAELFAKAEKLNALSGDAIVLRDQMAEYSKAWEAEREVREKEAESDDLPRVKFTTNKGDVVIELFENEAPGTVGNFISLVKKGYYDGLTFHRVLAGFMAQTGCPDGDGTGGPGYTIYDECTKPGFRKHFRGVLSMAKTNAPNSGGSQFFITFRPTPHLDGVHTVFGRVVEGMDVVVSLQRRDPDTENPPEPDTIVTAEVLRDRGHEYVPNKVE